jgi:hypothetical protein
MNSTSAWVYECRMLSASATGSESPLGAGVVLGGVAVAPAQAAVEIQAMSGSSFIPPARRGK